MRRGVGHNIGPNTSTTTSVSWLVVGIGTIHLGTDPAPEQARAATATQLRIAGAPDLRTCLDSGGMGQAGLCLGQQQAVEQQALLPHIHRTRRAWHGGGRHRRRHTLAAASARWNSAESSRPTTTINRRVSAEAGILIESSIKLIDARYMLFREIDGLVFTDRRTTHEVTAAWGRTAVELASAGPSDYCAQD